MMNSPRACFNKVPLTREKYWEYYEYYLGDQDKDERRHGQGENYWSGAKSLESYHGSLVRDTMHGLGTYRWKFYGPPGTFHTYEGYFYANCKHGYGILSYDDGRVFEIGDHQRPYHVVQSGFHLITVVKQRWARSVLGWVTAREYRLGWFFDFYSGSRKGLFYNDVRWGPGVESHANFTADVGLWQKNQLIRLAWRPPGLAVVPNFLSTLNGRLAVNNHRKLLTKTYIKIGEVNSAIELLKQSGCKPQDITEKWQKLYPKHCNDMKSQLCHVDSFDKIYYSNRCNMLQDCKQTPRLEIETEEDPSNNTSQTNDLEENIVYAWNNNDIIINIMKHCYQHESQRYLTKISLRNLLSGPRTRFRGAGKYETNCRSMLLACYLKRVLRVTQYMLDHNIHADISDVLGNSAIMFAACGDQPETIHFLVQSRGNVNGMNDSCCTPLGVTLLRYACVQKDIPMSKLLETVLPPPSSSTVPIIGENVSDWHIKREIGEEKNEPATKANQVLKKIKSTQSGSATPLYPDKQDEVEDDNDDHNKIKSEYINKANDLYSDKNANSITKPVEYLYQVRDMEQEMKILEEELKKQAADAKTLGKKSAFSKVIKETTKPSKDLMFQENIEETNSIDSAARLKIETLQNIQSTITQLLADGADPKLVRFPQPALFTALMSESVDVTKQIIEYGADVNEHYPDAFNYTPLQVAISQKFTSQSVEIIRMLLEKGADATHRLEPKSLESTSTNDAQKDLTLGPTLLHAVIWRKMDYDLEEEKSLEVINLLLQYNCDPLAQYNGSSALDLCLTRSYELFNTIIRHPVTNLNAIINSSKQSVLVKMLTPSFFKSLGTERTQMLTNLLLYGADPLRPCQNEEETYQNLFVFANKILGPLTPTLTKQSQSDIQPHTASKTGVDVKKRKEEPTGKAKKEDKSKQASKSTSDEITDCKEALKLVTGCARMLHVRWLQAKLFKELAEVVYTYKHRNWNMIIGEHVQKKSLSIWLSAQRGLEIWDALSKAKKKIYNDSTVLKYTLYIIHFYEIAQTLHKLRAPFMTAAEKAKVETYVNGLLREYRLQKPTETTGIKSLYVMPELASKHDKRFNVCFECALPRTMNMILCKKCKCVYFCSEDCIRANCDQGNTHPCNVYLISIYGITNTNDSSGIDEKSSPKN